MGSLIEEPCELLPWDSEFFGVRVARVRGEVLTDEHAREIDAWCREREVACLYFLARGDDAGSPRVAERNDYRLVDIRVTYERPGSIALAPEEPGGVEVRLARAGDIPALQEIARYSYTISRFYFDDNFARERCDSLYARWVAASFEGFAAAFFVATLDDAPVGFLTCGHDPQARTGSLDLMGVNRDLRGKGVANTLMIHALGWLRDQDVALVNTVTQGRNIKAQRVFQRFGFLLRDLQLQYHRWYDPERA
jgi:dTDP-4-amino-4,6-dideoxy-D-galactose acyltransferase